MKNRFLEYTLPLIQSELHIVFMFLLLLDIFFKTFDM